MLTGDDKSKLVLYEIVLRGTILAIIITIPSIIAFVFSWMILEDLTYAIILGTVIHFIVMGFSLKISKKILIKK